MPLYMYFPFLYFPKDKAEYIPATISMLVFMIAAVLFFRFMIKISNKQAKEAEELEKKLMMTAKQDTSDQLPMNRD